MFKLALAAGLALVACATQETSSSKQPVLTGDTCGLHAAADTCQADTDCTWLGTGCACPPNDPSCNCPAGECVAKDGGTGSGSGSGSSGAACACPSGGVCFEQIGGPAQQGSADPDIECAPPPASTGNPCPQIQNEGTCSDSPNVGGLCICDNGAR